MVGRERVDYLIPRALFVSLLSLYLKAKESFPGECYLGVVERGVMCA